MLFADSLMKLENTPSEITKLRKTNIFSLICEFWTFYRYIRLLIIHVMCAYVYERVHVSLCVWLSDDMLSTKETGITR